MHEPSWLKDAVFYNIYPQSFYDTNGDGIGDLPGITQKLPYLHELGFNAVWLNPFYVSPFRDAGYDIADFYKVAPRYGTNDDFAALRKVVADEELVRKYEALLGRYNAGDRAGLTDDPSFGLLNLRLNYYEFNGTVTASERVAFVDAQSGRAEALFTVPIYDETHPMGYSETVSLVSDGKGNFRISAVGYHLFDYPDMLYYNGQEDAD